MNRPNVPATHCVWNLLCDYAEHTGTREECEQWIRNTVSLGFGQWSDYEVR